MWTGYYRDQGTQAQETKLLPAIPRGFVVVLGLLYAGCLLTRCRGQSQPFVQARNNACQLSRGQQTAENHNAATGERGSITDSILAENIVTSLRGRRGYTMKPTSC